MGSMMMLKVLVGSMPMLRVLNGFDVDNAGFNELDGDAGDFGGFGVRAEGFEWVQ